MTKEKFNLANLGLPSKPQVVKSAVDTPAILEKAVENIHNRVEEAPVKVSEPIKKVSMDLPLDLYKAVKLYSVEAGISMKDYIAQLIRQDLAARKNQ